MDKEVTNAHVLLLFAGVAKYKVEHIGEATALPEIFSNPRRALSFLGDLGWQE